MHEKNISLHALSKHSTITVIFFQTIQLKKTLQMKRLRVFSVFDIKK